MTYEAWRISYQSSEQAARAAYAECGRLRAEIEAMKKRWLSPEAYHILMQEREDILFQAEKMKQRAPCKDISMWPNHHTQPAQTSPSVSAELLDRAIDTIGRFCSDEGWMQSDMDTLDALIAATEAKP